MNDAGEIVQGDVSVRDGRIAAIGPGAHGPHDTTIDASGALVLTGTARDPFAALDERFLALDGKTYDVDDDMCVIADDRAGIAKALIARISSPFSLRFGNR